MGNLKARFIILRLSDCIKSLYVTFKSYFDYNNIGLTKSIAKDVQCKHKPKKTGMATLISDKIYSRTRTLSEIKRDIV